uniref:Putative dioxygenase n=1 Tax=symbiont bacterium of Paederus fuscipes TaxID=176282 RepID=Q6VTA1_UNCXX|nr:putative dioxygenase [symbiont bacterium of Paederus fuscipes]
MSWIYDCAVSALRWWFDRRISGSATLEADQLFPNARHFVSNWAEIREEASRATRHLHKIPRFHELMRAQKSISANDGRDWRMFVARAYGVTFQPNLKQCPTLASILACSPDVLSASFSILGPGKFVPPHRGPFRGVLRGYLVLTMPKHDDGIPAAVLMIDGCEHRLEEGDFVLWDDTFEHSVWNESNESRIVLLLDIKRRNMPLDLSIVSNIIIYGIRLSILLSRSRRSLAILSRLPDKADDSLDQS